MNADDVGEDESSFSSASASCRCSSDKDAGSIVEHGLAESLNVSLVRVCVLWMLMTSSTSPNSLFG